MFTISTKLDYGLLIMVELAKSDSESGNDSNEKVYRSLQDIALEHGISPNYLSQLIIPLKQAGLVESKEGVHGGYRIAKQPDKINLRTIIEAMEGPLAIVRCMDDEADCPAESGCRTKPVWNKLKKDMYQLLEKKSLQDILA